MKLYGKEFYVIAYPGVWIGSPDWKDAAVCKMRVIVARTYDKGPLRGCVRGYEGWVRPLHVTDEARALELESMQEVSKKLCFATQDAANKELFKRKLRGEK